MFAPGLNDASQRENGARRETEVGNVGGVRVGGRGVRRDQQLPPSDYALTFSVKINHL